MPIAIRSALRRGLVPAALGAALFGNAGCTWISRLGTDLRGEPVAKTFYIGGAGMFGHIGTLDVPAGLRDGGYDGAIEVVGWQSWIGGALRDQIDRGRNARQARKLAGRIQDYLNRYPDRPVNLIALSAGTGVAVWALEALPESSRVSNVVFLSSSLSRQYDLSEALRRIDGKLYNFFSRRDPMLRYVASLAGSVDREFQGPNVAGQYGFALPTRADARTRKLYADGLRNMPWRQAYTRHGYWGLHTDGTNPRFVGNVITPLLKQDSEVGGARPPATSQPASRPARPEAG